MIQNKTTYQFLVFSILFTLVGNAQQVYIGSGFENASFKNYVNNLSENTLDLNYPKSNELFIDVGFRFDIDKIWERGWQMSRNRLKMDIGFSYNKYKINTGFYSGNTSIPLTYNLEYVAIKTGINFSIINEVGFKLIAHVNFSFDLLVSGANRYKNVVNNLYKDNSLDKSLWRYHRGLSAEYLISDKVSIYLNYNIADSFKEKNSDTNIEEKYSLHTHGISFGLLFNIQQVRY